MRIDFSNFPEEWKTNKNLDWWLHNQPEEDLLLDPSDVYIHPGIAVNFAKQFHSQELEELSKYKTAYQILKEANDYVVKLTSTQKEDEFHHTFKVDIPFACDSAAKKAEEILK